MAVAARQPEHRGEHGKQRIEAHVHGAPHGRVQPRLPQRVEGGLQER